MSSRREDFGTDTDIALVTFTEQENLVQYRDSNEVQFPILTDVDRNTYRAYGLERGSALRVYGPQVVRRYWKIMRKNGFRRLESATEDTLQLGGDFVIDPEGRLSWGFWGAGPDDRPSVDELVAAAQAATGRSAL